ncbi:MAG: SDR family oxidoreductase [Pseudomonadota bacterium]
MRKVALVTGAARGLGRAIVQDLIGDHDVAATWLTTTPDALPKEVLAVQADLTDQVDCDRLVAAVMDRFGRLDVIVNNAGAVVPSELDQFDVAAVQDMFHINVLAAQSLLVAALPQMSEGSAIVNISSVNATLPPVGAALYGASKAAINLWTRGMAKELGGRGIRVNAVAPGAVNDPEAPRSETLASAFIDDTALGRMATPKDIARAVRFLASDDAVFITGEILTVSGGYRL